MTVTSRRNAGAWLHAIAALDPTTVTAGGATDNVLQAGIVVDRRDVSAIGLSALLVGTLKTFSLGPATATVTLAIKDSPDGVTFTAYGDAITPIVKNTDGTFAYQADVDLSGADRYLRLDWTIDLSAGSVDTCAISGTWVLGGFAEVPPPVAVAAGASA